LIVIVDFVAVTIVGGFGVGAFVAAGGGFAVVWPMALQLVIVGRPLNLTHNAEQPGDGNISRHHSQAVVSPPQSKNRQPRCPVHAAHVLKSPHKGCESTPNTNIKIILRKVWHSRNSFLRDWNQFVNVLVCYGESIAKRLLHVVAEKQHGPHGAAQVDHELNVRVFVGIEALQFRRKNRPMKLKGRIPDRELLFERALVAINVESFGHRVDDRRSPEQ
jgi:hypothetical protein